MRKIRKEIEKGISIVAVCAFIMGNSDTRAKIFKWVAEKSRLRIAMT